MCGEAKDGIGAVILSARLTPELLVLDLSMPVMNGLDAARKIAMVSPRTEIVLFTAHVSEQLVREATSVGIRAVLQKDGLASLEHLLAILREATDDPHAA